jgi:opacity protein-like surface antigen
MRIWAFIGVLFAMLAGAAQAQDDERRDGAYVRVGAGATFLNNWEQDFTYNPNLVFIAPPPSGQSTEHGAGFTASAALGFDYADGIRTELEYRYAASPIDSVVQDTSLGPAPVTPANDAANAHLLLANFYFDFYTDSRLTPFIGGGVGGAFVENESGARDAALAYQGRAGVSYDLGGALFADLEYIFLRTNKLAYGPDPEDFTPMGPFGTAIAGVRYQSSSIMVSLRKHF